MVSSLAINDRSNRLRHRIGAFTTDWCAPRVPRPIGAFRGTSAAASGACSSSPEAVTALLAPTMAPAIAELHGMPSNVLLLLLKLILEKDKQSSLVRDTLVVVAL